jgi:hypothetical protein
MEIASCPVCGGPGVEERWLGLKILFTPIAMLTVLLGLAPAKVYVARKPN